MLKPAPTPSPIVRVLNEDVGRYHRWCTPSILEGQERVHDFYASDVSISAGFFGTLVDHTGIFEEAERFAAAAQGADRTMFSVHGSSGSNWIVLRTLALERRDALLLVARNIHHSVINAIKAFGLDFRFLPAPYEPRFEALLPPSVDAVVDGLHALPRGARRALHEPDLRGPRGPHARDRPGGPRGVAAGDGHRRRGLGRPPALPPRPAAERDGVRRGRLRAVDPQARRRTAADGPDPLARGPCGLRAARGGLSRVRHDLPELSPAGLAPTPPCGRSPPTARRRSARRSSAPASSRAACAPRLPDLDHLDDPAWIASVGDHAAACDLVKTTVGLSRYALSGWEVADALVERGIVIEKAGTHTITLITTFQLGADAVADTVHALVDILGARVLPAGAREPLTADPFAAIDDRPVMHPYFARRYAKAIGQEVALREAIGRVAAEEIEVYPPGIPIILEGFRVGADAVEYLLEARDKGGSIVARDTSLATLRVL